MTARATSIMALFGALVLIDGCAPLQSRQNATTLDQSAEIYVSALRWGNLQDAVAFLRARDGSVPTLDVETLKGIRVLSADYELAATSAQVTEARMVATFAYQPESSATVLSVTQRALWWYEPASERWFLEGGLPAF